MSMTLVIIVKSRPKPMPHPIKDLGSLPATLSLIVTLYVKAPYVGTSVDYSFCQSPTVVLSPLNNFNACDGLAFLLLANSAK